MQTNEGRKTGIFTKCDLKRNCCKLKTNWSQRRYGLGGSRKITAKGDEIKGNRNGKLKHRKDDQMPRTGTSHLADKIRCWKVHRVYGNGIYIHNHIRVKRRVGATNINGTCKQINWVVSIDGKLATAKVPHEDCLSILPVGKLCSLHVSNQLPRIDIWTGHIKVDAD